MFGANERPNPVAILRAPRQTPVALHPLRRSWLLPRPIVSPTAAGLRDPLRIRARRHLSAADGAARAPGNQHRAHPAADRPRTSAVGAARRSVRRRHAPEILQLQEHAAAADSVPRQDAIRGRVTPLLGLYRLSHYRPPATSTTTPVPRRRPWSPAATRRPTQTRSSQPTPSSTTTTWSPRRQAGLIYRTSRGSRGAMAPAPSATLRTSRPAITPPATS
jgi:hypothetical protein